MEEIDYSKNFKKFLSESPKKDKDIRQMIKEAILSEKEKAEKEADTEEVDMMADLEAPADTEEVTDTETETTPALDDDAKAIQDHLESALEGAKAMGDEKLIDQIGNTITFLVRSHVVKENEELGDNGFKEGKINLKLGSYYDIIDQGDGEIKSDNQYLGFDLNTREHVFKAMEAPGSNSFYFTMIPDKEIDNYVKESI